MFDIIYRYAADQITVYPSTNATDGGQFNKEEFISPLAKHATKVNHVIRELGDDSEYFTLSGTNSSGFTQGIYISVGGLCCIDGYYISLQTKAEPKEDSISWDNWTGTSGYFGLMIQKDEAGHLQADTKDDVAGGWVCNAVVAFKADTLSDLEDIDENKYLLLGGFTSKTPSGVFNEEKKYICYNVNNIEFNFSDELKLHRIVLQDTPQAKVVIDDNPTDGNETIGMTIDYGMGGTKASYGVFETELVSSEGSSATLEPGSLDVSTSNKSIVERPLYTERAINIKPGSSVTRSAGYPASIFLDSDGNYVTGLFSHNNRIYLGPISPQGEGVITDGLCTVMANVESGGSIDVGDLLSPIPSQQSGSVGYRKTTSSDNIVAGIALENRSHSMESLVFEGLTASDLGFKILTIPEEGTTITYEKTEKGIFFSELADGEYVREQEFDKSDVGCAANGYNTDDDRFDVGSFSAVSKAEAHTIRGCFWTDGDQEKTVDELPSGSYYIVLNGTSDKKSSDSTGFYGLTVSDIKGHQRALRVIEDDLNISINESTLNAAVSSSTSSMNYHYAFFIFLDIAKISTDKLPGIQFDDTTHLCTLTIENGSDGKFNLTYTPTADPQTYPIKMLIRNVVRM